MTKENRAHFKILLVSTCLLVFLSGCGRKYHPPVLPYAPTIEKIATNEIATIKQGSLMEADVEKTLCGAPSTMRATTIQIENKTNKPLVVEIDQSNLSIYDREDLAHICSKEALLHSDKNSHTFRRSATRNLIQAGTTIAALLWAGFIGATWQPSPGSYNLISKLCCMWLPSAAAAYINYTVSKSHTHISESEEELFFNQFRQMFTGTMLAFDDCIEIAPHNSLKQIIFFDAEPTESCSGGQRKLVLRLISDNQQTLIPLEL